MPGPSLVELDRNNLGLDLDGKLARLLADPGFRKAIDGAAREAVANWGVPLDEARRAVLSGIGDPGALGPIHDAWIAGKTGLAKVIVRRRMLDRFAEDARRANHRSIALAVDADLGLAASRVDAGPGVLERLVVDQAIEHALAALTCFAALGDKQHEQAALLRRYFIDETPYPQLSSELACSRPALRVRVCKALRSLRTHIASHHPELPLDGVARRGHGIRG